MTNIFKVIDTSIYGEYKEVAEFNTFTEALRLIFSWGENPKLENNSSNFKQVTIVKEPVSLDECNMIISSRTYRNIYRRTWKYNLKERKWKIISHHRTTLIKKLEPLE